MCKLLLLIILMFPSQLWGVNCDKNPIFCTIKVLKPSIDEEFAMRLSNLIHKYAKQYGVDPYRSLAILRQENNFENVDRIIQVTIGRGQNKKKVNKVSDVGICQFNVATIKDYSLNIKRLKTDLDYALHQHFILLQKKIKSCKHLGENSWSCYHSKNRRARLKYVRQVNRWYKPLITQEDI